MVTAWPRQRRNRSLDPRPGGSKGHTRHPSQPSSAAVSAVALLGAERFLSTLHRTDQGTNKKETGTEGSPKKRQTSGFQATNVLSFRRNRAETAPPSKGELCPSEQHDDKELR